MNFNVDSDFAARVLGIVNVGGGHCHEQRRLMKDQGIKYQGYKSIRWKYESIVLAFELAVVNPCCSVVERETAR
jgi:hypothetical protein